jgi:hypothetical protein
MSTRPERQGRTQEARREMDSVTHSRQKAEEGSNGRTASWRQRRRARQQQQLAQAAAASFVRRRAAACGRFVRTEAAASCVVQEKRWHGLGYGIRGLAGPKRESGCI